MIGVEREVGGNEGKLRVRANLGVEKVADFATPVIVFEAGDGGLVRHAGFEMPENCRLVHEEASMNPRIHRRCIPRIRSIGTKHRLLIRPDSHSRASKIRNWRASIGSIRHPSTDSVQEF